MADPKVAAVTARLRDAILEDFAEHGIVLSANLPRVPRISTGLPALDLITGGGIPIGMLTMFWGQESAGKSTCALYCAREHIAYWLGQDDPRLVVWMDGERSYEDSYAASLGVNTDYVIPHRPETGETAEQTLEKILRVAENPVTRVGRVGLIVVDSMNVLTTARSMEAGMGDKDMGNSAKMWTNFARRFPAPIDEHNIGLLVIAQMRKNLGVMYGSPETLSGGEALKHGTRLRVKFRPAGDIKSGKGVVGVTLKPIVVKRKVYGAVHKGTAEMQMYFNPRPYIDPIPQLTSVGKSLGVFTNKEGKAAGQGYWFYDGQQVAIGENNVTKNLREKPDLLGAVSRAVREAIERRIDGGEELPVELDLSAEAEDDFPGEAEGG